MDIDSSESTPTHGVYLLLPYLLEYKSHFFVPENQSKNGGATYTRG